MRNLNDGTHAAPALRIYLNKGTIDELPDWSSAPRGDDRTVYAAIKAAGYAGLQWGNAAVCRALGLGYTMGGRVDQVGDADALAAQWKDAGAECLTIHIGTGLEDESAACRLVEDVLAACARHDFPMYVETHRATITQDAWRTLRLIERFPELRFNGDFSHWYTGHEMPYGDLAAKFDLYQPVFDRVRFLHGRIGTPCCMQVDVGDGSVVGRPFVEHFRTMWTRCFAAFRRTAAPGDYIVFAPELLSPPVYYARTFPDANGTPREESDRWAQGLVLAEIARACWQDTEA